MGMTIDMTEFEKGFKKLVDQATPAELEKGLVKAANLLIEDAKNEAPQAPYKTGDLRGSSQINAVVVTKDDVSVEAGFNIEYAARWHDAEAGTINWTRKGKVMNPGPKYLESKMERNSKKYLDKVGEQLRALLGG